MFDYFLGYYDLSPNASSPTMQQATNSSNYKFVEQP